MHRWCSLLQDCPCDAVHVSMWRFILPTFSYLKRRRGWAQIVCDGADNFSEIASYSHWENSINDNDGLLFLHKKTNNDKMFFLPLAKSRTNTLIYLIKKSIFIQNEMAVYPHVIKTIFWSCVNKFLFFCSHIHLILYIYNYIFYNDNKT